MSDVTLYKCPEGAEPGTGLGGEAWWPAQPRPQPVGLLTSIHSHQQGISLEIHILPLLLCA